MSIYALSDLHLPLGIDKPMDIFGRGWENYVERIQENWQSTVNPQDTVVLGGDFSWATYLEEAYKDFEFLKALPGKKILLKGNHDYWWTTAKKLKEFTSSNGFSDMEFLHNNSFIIENTAICGTRGWSWDGQSSGEDKKIYERELVRLKLSLDSAKAAEEILVFTHFPPTSQNEFHKILKEYNVKKCFYGHLHGPSHSSAFCGLYDGVEYVLVSGDYLGFQPLKIK